MFTEDTFNFFNELKKNNTKEWFDQNRKWYKEKKSEFAAFIDDLIAELLEFDHHLADVSAKDSIFRINRDVRFSNNKDPYKTNMGAYIAFGGRKSDYAGYYFHLEPDNCFLGGGMYIPSTPVLRKIRQEIDYNATELKEIIEAPIFKKTFGEIQGDRLKTAPQGYPKDHPEIELLQLKSYFVMHPLTNEEVLSKNLLQTCIASYKVMFPFNKFLNEIFIN